MKIPGQVYYVGGCVRDLLTGVTLQDYDYCVVGATVAEMKMAGFSQVGASFPVFLHPETKQEYALARTERSVGKGHTDFKVETTGVTLYDDLMRRDVTINAMAFPVDKDPRDYKGLRTFLIDPFGGREDLRAGMLKAVSPAFSEDPLRVFRTARFAARFGFRVDSTTMGFMRNLVLAGLTEELAVERIAQETIKAFHGTRDPRKFFRVLAECGVLEAHFPEVVGKLEAIDRLFLLHSCGHHAFPRLARAMDAVGIATRLKMSAETIQECRDIQTYAHVLENKYDAEFVAKMFDALRAYHSTDRLLRLLDVSNVSDPVPVMQMLTVAKAVDQTQFAHLKGDVRYGKALYAARFEAIRESLKGVKS